MDGSQRSRRGGWRILLGVKDDAAMRRALLSAGRDRRDAGASVLVACFEPPQTEAAGLDGMPVVPLLSAADGSERVDLRAIREQRPDVVLLDDLARLAPQDAERIPAVDAIRSLGIDVISTLRASEIASLAHALAPSSRASSRVPDRALLEADDVEVVAGDSRCDLVDLAHEWAKRPRPRPEAGGAQDHAWPGRLVVAFDAAPDADAIITRAADLARVTGAHLVGANVRTITDTADEPALHELRRQLEAVDADVVEVVDDDPGVVAAAAGGGLPRARRVHRPVGTCHRPSCRRRPVMTDHLFVAPRHINIERALTAYPPETQHHFRGDPADWLPGRLTMHGGSTFHMRTRFLGANVTLQYTVGPPWMRRDTATRSLRIEFLEPPFGMAWLLPVVEGELTLWGDPRPQIRFEGRSVVSGLLGVRIWTARMLVRAVTAGITDRLSTHAPPRPPSEASPAG